MLKLQARGATRSTSVLLVAQARELMPQSIVTTIMIEEEEERTRCPSQERKSEPASL
ncbi:uncharacterized protein BDR25DRAFT_355030 [Lindgomyces ingoldianus]|uniref:Uncharacterized protein n=1 Tax=Lindgomyces ingoldianus TaxID=673940 RepID=A0ACB6QVQ1_9PLEO|nr:uncharacterized protein BDR25DRAFT_355030 [Lindgomyces ingoldianus]KAF2471124.1 hypothetical protein BDR25DRAFT_355030 [Lindgomyces ingoldianus]